MKPFILMIALAATSIAACSNPQTSNAQQAGVPPAAAQSQKVSLQEVITHYLHLKNALASDNSNEAATAGGELHTALTDLGKQTMSETQKKAYAEIEVDAEENAEHNAEKGGNIKPKRKQFQGLNEKK